MTAELHPIAPGVVRVSWTERLQEEGVGPASEEVRRVVALGFAEGHSRVETHVVPGDTAGHRIATFSGLMREGVARGIDAGQDRVVYARLADDVPVEEPMGFRSLLNSFLPRKRAIGQLLVRDTGGRVLLCRLTYKRDHDLPGGVVEVGESPRAATAREVREELGLSIEPGPLLLTDWLPPWGGWDDAVCLVFDGGVHEPAVTDRIVKQAREIRSAHFHTLDEVSQHCADFTARRVHAALASLAGSGTAYTESGREP
ncbi:MAG: NUDIX domain-containing protein [Marmoricola sp.]